MGGWGHQLLRAGIHSIANRCCVYLEVLDQRRNEKLPFCGAIQREGRSKKLLLP